MSTPTVIREQHYNCIKCQGQSVQIREEMSDGNLRIYVQPRNHAWSCPKHQSVDAHYIDLLEDVIPQSEVLTVE